MLAMGKKTPACLSSLNRMEEIKMVPECSAKCAQWSCQAGLCSVNVTEPLHDRASANRVCQGNASMTDG
jgi:hypothetical protein